MNETFQVPKSFFRTGRYILFWVSSLFSNIGTWMQQIAQPWVVLSLSNSAFWVGLDSFAMNTPGWLFTLWGGVLADRYDRKRVVLFFQTIQFLCIITMVILLILSWLKVWMIVIISFLVGLTDSLSMPSFQSIIPSIVEKKDIHKAVSLNSTQFNLSRILGPAIAGVVIVRFGAVACFSANAASYIPFFLSLYFIYPSRGLKLQQEPIEAKPIQQLKEFQKLLFNRQVRIPLMTALVTNMFCAPLITFSVVLLKNVFHAELTQFGWAVAAFGTGGLIGAAVTFIPLPPSFKRNIFATGIAILSGMIIVAIGLNHSIYVLIALLIFAGAALTTSNISINTFLQENATNNSRGRILSMFQLALSGGISMGALFTGITVSKLNISNALLINGIFAIAFQICLLWKQLKTPVAPTLT
ncbi:MAG: MFS transporter [Chitinophagales bacterium]